MLRAINDVNLPKFLDEDVPLFLGILSDLFPGIALPEMDYVDMTRAFYDVCARMHLQVRSSLHAAHACVRGTGPRCLSGPHAQRARA